MLREKANKIFRSKGFYVTFSIFAAILLWLYVTNVENKELDVTIPNIPVNYIGCDELLAKQNLYVDTTKGQTVTLTVRGKRNNVNKLDKSNININVELSDIRVAGTLERIFSVGFPSDVNASELYIIGQSPRYILVEVERYVMKDVEIDAVFNGDVAEGFMAQPVQVRPEKLTVRGPESVVSQIEYAQVSLDQKNISKTVTTKLGYTFIDSTGKEVPAAQLKTDTDTVDVTLPVNMVKEVALAVDLVPGGGADKTNTTIRITPDRIKLSGDSEDLEKIDRILLDTYDLKNINGTQTKMYQIPIPKGATSLSGETMVTVIIQINDLVTKKVKVTNFTFTNLTPGYKATAVTQSVDVTVRGVEEIVNLITADNINIVVDLKDLGKTTGTYSVKANGAVNGYVGAGIVGDYNVVLTLTSSG